MLVKLAVCAAQSVVSSTLSKIKNLLESEIATWEKQRNSQQASVNWRFQTTDARRKMERLYPTV